METVFHDTFIDTDTTALAAHTPDVDDAGNGWVENSGTFEISANAVVPTGSDPGGIRWMATFESDESDGEIGAIFRNTSSVALGSGIVVRCVDDDNLVFVGIEEASNEIQLYYWEGGNATLVTKTTDTEMVDDIDYLLHVEFYGTSIKVYLDSRLILDETVDKHTSATKHGIRFGEDTMICRELWFTTSPEPIPSCTKMDHLVLRPVIRPETRGVFLRDRFTGTAGTTIDGRLPDDVASKPWMQRIGTGIEINAGGSGVIPSADELCVATFQSFSRDGLFRFDVTLDVSDPSNVGIVLRYDPSDNTFIWVTPNGIRDEVRVYRYNGTTHTLIESWAYALEDGTYTLWVTLEGEKIGVAVDDDVVGWVRTNAFIEDRHMNNHGVVFTGTAHSGGHFCHVLPNKIPLRADRVVKVTEDEIRNYHLSGQRYANQVSLSSSPLNVSIGAVREADSSIAKRTVWTRLSGDQTEKSLFFPSLANETSAYAQGGVDYATPTGGSQIAQVYCDYPLRGVLVGEDEGSVNHGSGAWCSPQACEYGGDTYWVLAVGYAGDRYLWENGSMIGKIFDGYAGDDNEYLHNGCAILATDNGVLCLMSGHAESQIKACYLPGGDYSSRSDVRTIGDASSKLSYCCARLLSNGDVIILSRGSDDGDNSVSPIVYRITNAEDLVASAASYTVDQIRSGVAAWYPNDMLVDENDVVTVIWSVRSGSSPSWRYIAAAIYAPEVGANGRWYQLDGSDADAKDVLGTTASPRFQTIGDLLVYESAANTIIGAQFHISHITQAPSPTTAGKAEVLVPCVWSDGADHTVYDPVTLRCLRVSDDLTTEFRDGADAVWTGSNSVRMTIVGWGNTFAVHARGTRVPTNYWDETINPYYDWGGADEVEIIEVTDPFGTDSYELTNMVSLSGRACLLGLVQGSSDDKFTAQLRHELSVHASHIPARVLVYLA